MKCSGAAPCQCHSPGGYKCVPGTHDDDVAAARLHEADAIGDVQGLPDGVGMPGGAGARGECRRLHGHLPRPVSGGIAAQR
jgi:hypothetical protein